MKIHVLNCGYIDVSRDLLFGGGNARVDMPKAATAPGSKRTTLPVHAFLVEHRTGLFLIDTGWSRAISPKGVYDRTAVSKELPVHLAAMYRPYVPEGMAVDEQLSSMDIKVSDIDAVIITHLDPDHVSGLRSVSGAKRLIIPEDEAYWSVRTKYRLRQPRLWEIPGVERIFYRGRPLGPVGKAVEITEDGSIMYVNLPGHTDGQAGVVLKDKGGYAVIAADAAVSAENWETMRAPGYAANGGIQKRTLEWLAKMAKDPDCKAVLCSHDKGLEPQVIEI